MHRDVGQTAVVVEDDPIQRELLASVLEEFEFSVIQCESAETALLEIEACQLSFLVTDVNLAGDMDGVELAHRVRAHDPDVRIVVVSGRDHATSLPRRAKFYLKPLDPVALRREAAQ